MPRWRRRSPIRRRASSLPALVRTFHRPTSRRHRRWLRSRRPKSRNGGRSSRLPASRANDHEDRRAAVLRLARSPRPAGDVFARALERIEIMDQTGYDAVWLAEHHFTTFSVCPSVHMMGVAGGGAHQAAAHRHGRVAGRASTTRCGSPRRWRCSTCCRAAGSTGAPAAASRASSSTPSACRSRRAPTRFREAVEIVLQAWTQERFTFHGKHFDFDDVEVLPKPMQQPHPPVWMAATSESAIDWAAGRGFSILMDPHCPDPSSAPSAALRREAGRRRLLRRTAATSRWPG